ncbi:AbiH family protein [Acinetobacter pittii]|uniref:AbiH family protein n=1 Tax=Acinetobacter pittii TaxID=48296 RepID=UPI0013D035FD|nr:AbiH family protein [Acinetobacter pittii]
MNILIIGNGFDLSHYLPTKYDHFMAAMHSIEDNTSDVEMGFDDIFKKLLISEKYFFEKTRELYDVNQIKLSTELIKELKFRLIENCWYKYFSLHSKEIRTWIDFEQKIEEALVLVADILNKIEKKYEDTGKFNYEIFTLSSSNSKYYFPTLQFQLLKCLGLIKSKFDEPNNDYKEGYLTKEFFTVEGQEKFGFNSRKFLSSLQKELNNFIDLFNIYIQEIIKNLNPTFDFNFHNSNNINKVFSFNYTNTFERFYKKNTTIEYLHGKSDTQHNLVLGISDIYNPSLLNSKMYGFTKYHQKIFKETQYNFLNDIILNYNKLQNELKKLESELALKFSLPIDREGIYREIGVIKSQIKNFKLNISIWGHSLDVSDEVYINEIFSLNEDRYDNVQVTIYYFDENAKFELLANLIHILKKDKVEKWMKNKWLYFKKNPDLFSKI